MNDIYTNHQPAHPPLYPPPPPTPLQLLDKCQAEVSQLKGKKVLVTGHSLGGAMTLFFTLKLWQVCMMIVFSIGNAWVGLMGQWLVGLI